jgi:invasion protein IalB
MGMVMDACGQGGVMGRFPWKDRSMLIRHVAVLAFLPCIVVPSLAQAQSPVKPAASATAPVSHDPQATTATYGDWVLRCQKQGEGAPAIKTCEVAQSLQVQGQADPVVQIAIGRLSQKDPLKLVIVVPTNVSFPSTPQLAIDEKDEHPAMLTWRRCVPGGCVAETIVKDDLLKRWRSQSGRGRLQIKDAGNRDVVLPFSFRGLSEALDALNRS